MKIIKEPGKKNSAYHPDWEVDGNTWIEVKARVKSIGVVRQTLLQLAYTFSESEPPQKAMLLLIDPSITRERLRDEWKKAKRTLRPVIAGNITIAVYQNGRLLGIPNDPEPEMTKALLKVCKQEISSKSNPLPRPDYKAEIYKIVICNWLNKEGPMTSSWLAGTAGCNYRTVANALESFGNALIRHSDRSVELEYFPGDIWQWLVVNSGKSRLTKRYSDRSGQPRPIESLLKRIATIEQPAISIGGVPGAGHHYPDMDLVGTPRLDLTVHCPDKYLNLDFVEKLDPALKEETDLESDASVVVHILRRKESFFRTDSNGLVWADPVECLLDLHEMHLETQALDFVNYLQSRGEAPA